MRVLRVARMLRLVVRAQKLQVIFYTLLDAASTLSALGLLLLLALYLFTVIGVQNFALLDLKKSPGLNSELNEHANF